MCSGVVSMKTSLPNYHNLSYSGNVGIDRMLHIIHLKNKRVHTIRKFNLKYSPGFLNSCFFSGRDPFPPNAAALLEESFDMKQKDIYLIVAVCLR